MKKLIVGCSLFIVLIFSFALNIFTVKSAGATGFETVFYPDINDIFEIGLRENSVYVHNISSEKNAFTYSFDGEVRAFCVFKGKTYVLVTSALKDLYYIETLQNGETSRFAELDNLQLSDGTPAFAIDSHGRIYVTDKKRCCLVFDKDGTLLYKTGHAVDFVVSAKDAVYASGANLYRLSGTDEMIIAGAGVSGRLRSSGGNYFYDIIGNVFSADTDAEKVFTSDGSPDSISVTKNRITVLKDGVLYGYDKADNTLLGKYAPKPKTVFIGTVDGKLCSVTASGSYTFYNADELFLKSESPTESEKSHKKDNSRLDLSSFTHDSRYIYLEKLMPLAKLRNSIPHSGFEVNFGARKGNNIAGTGAKISFNRSGKTKKYTVILHGDLTGEGNINGRDIETMFNELLGDTHLNSLHALAADLNSDKKLSNADLVLLARKIE